jgi:hypothetical protein
MFGTKLVTTPDAGRETPIKATCAIPTLNEPDGTVHAFAHDIRDLHTPEIAYIGFSHLNDAEALARYNAEAIKIAAVVSKKLNLQPSRPDGK